MTPLQTLALFIVITPMIGGLLIAAGQSAKPAKPQPKPTPVRIRRENTDIVI